MRHFFTPSALLLLLLSLLLLLPIIHAAKQPTTYCKCICFQNSTIIPLNSPPSDSSTSSPASSKPLLLNRNPAEEEEQDKTSSTNSAGDGGAHHRTLTCNDCNRAFCLSYNLPICKNAKQEDVFAQCFQRDSLKDRTIVTIFIITTASLLGWALLKPFVVKSGIGDVVGQYTSNANGSSAGGTGQTLPGPNGRLAQGFGVGDDSVGGRIERAGGRGSISRQGGLNS